MAFVKMALKNILRNKKRAMRTIGILAMGVVIFVFYGTLMEGFGKMSIDMTIDEDTAHVRIQHAEFNEDFPYTIENFMSFDEKSLTSIQGIHATPSIRMDAEVDNYEDSLPVVLMGIDYKTALDVFAIHTTATEELKDGVWLAAGIAADMNLVEGDFINITFRNKDGGFVSAEYEITGLLNSSNPLFSAQTAMIDLAELQDMMHTDEITFCSVKIDHELQIEKITQEIRNAYTNYKVLDVKELTRDLQTMMHSKDIMFIPFYFVIALITFLGLANSILISVWEKRKTMGTLRALGFYDREIICIFMYEGFFVGLLGTVIGVVLGALINIPLASTGINLEFMAKMGNGKSMFDDIGFYMPPVMKSTWNPIYFVGPLVVIPIVSMLISYIPARKSIKMSIVDCIKNKD